MTKKVMVVNKKWEEKKIKMKKIILLFMILLLNITLVGCNKKGNAKLDAKTELYIKQCVINYNRLKNSSYSKTIDDIYIKYYYGDFDGIKIAVIEGDTISNLAVVRKPFYVCYVEENAYLIKCLPEIISVYYENNYHTLPDACKDGLITKKILDQLDCYY